MRSSLLIEWRDHRGRIWNLGTGEEGVILDLGQEGLERSEVKHEYTRGGMRWAGAQVQRAQPSLKVCVGAGLSGQEYFDVAEAWSRANSYTKPGVLRFTRPDGEIREMACRLRGPAGVSHTYDPGQEFSLEGDRIEPWLLEGETPFWQGRVQQAEFGQATTGGVGGAQPFFGTRGYGWPLYIGSNELVVLGVGSAKFSNRGEGPMWLIWRLHGPMTNPTIGVPGGTLHYKGRINAGETIEIVTEPGKRAVTELSTGVSRFELCSGRYVPLGEGVDISLTAEAEGMGAASRIEVIGRTQHERPF